MDNIPLDRDFIQTIEGFYFCIVGYVHPPNRVLAYLKYIPSESGKWKFENQPLQRMLPFYSAQAVIDTFQFLKKNYGHYLFHDKVNNMTFSAVPFDFIKKYYSAKKELGRIVKSKNLDPLQSKLKSFVNTLSHLSGVPIAAFGITGSILLNIHNPDFSDMDVTIHGHENALKVKQTMKTIRSEGHTDIVPLNLTEREKWQKDKAQRFGMSQDDAAVIFARKWNMGEYKKTRFSLHPIRILEELDEKYGDKTFIRKGDIEVQATIIDDSETIFLPSIYKINDVKILNGKNVENIREIVSYEGLFDSIGEKNEVVRAKGQLELVKDIHKKINYYRIVIGSRKEKAKEFLIFKSPD